MAKDSIKGKNYTYDPYGLFLGLISYPFDKDGKKIYKDLDVFFEEHKKRLVKYDPSKESDLTEFNEYLYKPAGYRMFGSQGLAVLSLVDDYAFPIRYFDKDHIQTLFEEAGMKSNDKTEVEEIKKIYFDGFHSVAVMGVTERKEGEASIIQKAETSFLNEKSRFPFIGIIRLKIKSQKYLLDDENGEVKYAIMPIDTYDRAEDLFALMDSFDGNGPKVKVIGSNEDLTYEEYERIKALIMEAVEKTFKPKAEKLN